MKNLTYLLAIALLFSTVFTSCDDDDDNNNGGNCTNGFTATVDGTAFTAVSVTAQIRKGEDPNANNVPGKRFDLNATDANGLIFSLAVNNIEFGTTGDCMKLETITGDILGGNFCLGSSGCEFALVTILDPTGGGGSATSGVSPTTKITITDCDPSALTISGTFEGELTNTSTLATQVVSGTFTDVCYVVIEQ